MVSRGGAAGGAGGAAAPPYFGPWPPKIFWGPLDFWLSAIKCTILSNFSISMPFPFSHQFERCSGCCFLFVSLLPFFSFWENKIPTIIGVFHCYLQIVGKTENEWKRENIPCFSGFLNFGLFFFYRATVLGSSMSMLDPSILTFLEKKAQKDPHLKIKAGFFKDLNGRGVVGC